MNEPLKPLAWPAYGVAFLLVVIPVADTVLGVLPVRMGEVAWRFGAAGMMSRAVMTPLLGLLIALTTAAVFRHRMAARVLAILSFVGTALLLGGIAVFSLDALQARAQVRPEAASAFGIASGVALAKYALGAVVTALAGIAGWKVSRRSSAAAPTRRHREPDAARAAVLLESRSDS